MYGIQDCVEDLQPVAIKRCDVRHHLHALQSEGVVQWKPRHVIRRPEVGENQAFQFNDWISAQADARAQSFIGSITLTRRVQQCAIDIKMPAVVTAAYAARLAVAKFQ